ncbi:MAG: phosphoenolpyruvate carboxykinase (GTP), partial [Clostridia bacterium]|nr:phosphoenolpyruvate carboxykinase (GTP) [Clostridia bacterium]
VPISAFIFGGRRAQTTPLVYQSRDWNHGVFVGSTMASETTAAAAGAVGVVRRDPMAMLPFCGYNMGDYFAHWIEMGKKIPHAPKIFNVNWFRQNEQGEYLWPGFGDNMRVLEWILDRCAGKADAVETAIGYLPKAEDINIEGLKDIDLETVKGLLSVDKDLWKEDIVGIKEFYAKFDEDKTLPEELAEELAKFESRLDA